MGPRSRGARHSARPASPFTVHAARNTSLLLVALSLCGPASAQPAREHQIQAVFLYKFALYTEWPAQAFAATNSPLVIGILGTDPFGDYLDQTVRGEFVRGRRLAIQRYPTLAQIETCHILYIGQSERSRLEQVLAQLQGTPTLTVTDLEGGARQGVMIRFISERSRIRFRVNLTPVRAANLSLSAKLLQVAEIVGEEK